MKRRYIYDYETDEYYELSDIIIRQGECENVYFYKSFDSKTFDLVYKEFDTFNLETYSEDEVPPEKLPKHFDSKISLVQKFKNIIKDLKLKDLKYLKHLKQERK